MYSPWTVDGSFGAHGGNLKEGRPILSAAEVLPKYSTFRRYKVYADILGGSVVRRPQTTMWWSEPVIFLNNFGCYIFGTFIVEAIIIMQRHEVPCRRSIDPKMIDLE